jgi:phosphoribosylaminoimidazolecarboxamide formyltransferase/IMP cyclohydrolase
MPRALLSVSDKTGIAEVGRGLASRGFILVSTGGTARALTAAGLGVTRVSDVTGLPEMMDGRVKTLHPALHAGILARRDRPDDLAALERCGFGLFDVVIVNLYPFVESAANPALSLEVLLEQIDIGGPSLVRAAAKNFRHVLVVVDSTDYPRVLDALDGTPSLAFRFELARKAFAHTAAYDVAIAGTLATVDIEADRVERRAARPEPAFEIGVGTAIPEHVTLSLDKISDLRYGENPHQRAGWYRGGASTGFGAAAVLQGRDLSYTNLLDLDAAARIVLEFEEPAAAVVKHTNPCGVAIGRAPAEAYVRARDADSLSAFGGVVALNRPIDVDTARAIITTKIDAVIAPSVDAGALEILAGKPKTRVVTANLQDVSARMLELHSILGAILAQEPDLVLEARAAWGPGALPEGFRVVSRRQPAGEEWDALRFAWRVCAHVKSNSIVFTNRVQTLAIGAGQMSRVDAVRAAAMMARGSTGALAGSVAATDGFFPFRDGVDAVAATGATAVIHPGGSVRDPEVIAAADEHGLAMVVTGRRHFRH